MHQNVLQDFVVKNDSSCGSTIGPVMSAKLGMPTVDTGSPQLSIFPSERCVVHLVFYSVLTCIRYGKQRYR